jgi:hypothetical protein
VFQVGDRVNHEEYGLGSVLSVDGVGHDYVQVAEVEFGRDIGVRCLLPPYEQIEKL